MVTEPRSRKEHIVGWQLFGQTEGRVLSAAAAEARISHRESLHELVLETAVSQGLSSVSFGYPYSVVLPRKVIGYIERFSRDDVLEVVGISDESNAAQRAAQAAGILAVASEGLRRFAVRMVPELTLQDIDDFVPNLPTSFEPPIADVDVP